MPSTYPRMKDRSYPHPPHSPQQSPHTPNHQSPKTPSTPSSRFLSPIQEARILSWRGHTTPMPDSPKTDKVTKSAPATLDHDPSCAASGSSHHSREKASSAGHSVSRGSCSCTSNHRHPPQSSRPTLPGRHTVANVSDNRSKNHGGHHQPHQMRSYYSSKKKSSTSASTSTPPVLSPPMSRGPPASGTYFSPQPPPQQQENGYDAPPMQYTQTAPQIPPPIAQPPPPRPDPPRIAGARDPISQNYWRGRFPPVGGPMGINSGLPFAPFMHPGTYPPQAFGMGQMGQMGPWG